MNAKLLDRIHFIGIIIFVSTSLVLACSSWFGFRLPTAVLWTIVAIDLVMVLVMEIVAVKRAKVGERMSLSRKLEGKEVFEKIKNKEVFFPMFSELSRGKKIDAKFVYAEIDEDVLRTLKMFDIEQIKKEKEYGWCINAQRQIAFIKLVDKPSILDRGKKRKCVEEYLVISQRECAVVSVCYSRKHFDKSTLRKVNVVSILSKSDSVEKTIKSVINEVVNVFRAEQILNSQKEKEYPEKDNIKTILGETVKEDTSILSIKKVKESEERVNKETSNLELKKMPEKVKAEKKKVHFETLFELDEHDEIDMNFEYTEIDEDSLRIIEQLGVEERKDFRFKKWCINQKKQLAFVHLLYVSPAILRCDGNDCFERYLVVCRDEYFVMEIDYPDFHIEYADFKKIKVEDDFCKVNIPKEQLSNALIEAIKTYHEGRKIDYQKERELEKKESLRKTPNKIMQGVFSPLMQKMVNGVKEVSRIEYVFRKLCLKHFTEYNVAVQGYDRFYLHDDEDSFLLFDVLLWMYLHLGNSMEQLKMDWGSVVNEQYQYRNAFSEDFLKHFCIGGDKRFFFEKYFQNRMEEEKIFIKNDNISFSSDYSEHIISYLEKEKDTFINSELLINDTIEENKNNQNAEKEGLHFILLKEWQIDHMIMGAFKPEPSGYGAMPPEQLNVVYGVADKEERFILTKYKEEKSDTFKGGYKSYYVIWYKKTVDSRDNIRELTVSCEMNKKREKFFDLRRYWNLWGDFEEYSNKIMLAIRYYEKSDELKKIEEEIRQAYSKSLQAYGEERHREITEKYKKKWK